MSRLPEGWRKVPLKQVASLTRGSEPGTEAYCEADEGLRFYRVGDLTGKSDNPIYTKPSASLVHATPDDIVLTLDGSPGIVYRGLDGAISSGIRIVAPLNGELRPDYLFFGLQSPWVQQTIGNYTTGSTILHAGRAADYIELNLPPLAEQQKIAEILGSVDDALGATRRVIEHTRQLKRAMLQQLLTQGLPGRHTQFKDSPLGCIPAGWEVKTLGEVVEFYNGKAHEADISDEGKFIVVNSKFISTDGEVKKFSNKSYLPALTGDILIVMSDIPNGRALARVFFVDEDNLYTVNQRVGLLRSKKDNPEFLALCLNRHPHFLSFNDGVKQTNLRKEEVLSCPLPIPSNIKEQKDIVSIIENIDLLIQYNTAYLNQLEQSKNSLLHKLLSGEIRVPVGENKE